MKASKKLVEYPFKMSEGENIVVTIFLLLSMAAVGYSFYIYAWHFSGWNDILIFFSAFCLLIFMVPIITISASTRKFVYLLASLMFALGNLTIPLLAVEFINIPMKLGRIVGSVGTFFSMVNLTHSIYFVWKK